MTEPLHFDDSYLSVYRHLFSLDEAAKILNHEYPLGDHIEPDPTWEIYDDDFGVRFTTIAKAYEHIRGITGAELSQRLKDALVYLDIVSCHEICECLNDCFCHETRQADRLVVTPEAAQWWADLLWHQLAIRATNDAELTARQLTFQFGRIYSEYFDGDFTPISFQQQMALMLIDKLADTPQKVKLPDPTLFDEFDEAQTDYVVVRCLKKLIRIEEHHLGRGEVSVGGVVVEHGSTWPLNDEWSRIGTQVVLKASKAKESAGVVLGDEVKNCFYVTLRAPHILHVSAYCCASGGDE